MGQFVPTNPWRAARSRLWGQVRREMQPACIVEICDLRLRGISIDDLDVRVYGGKQPFSMDLVAPPLADAGHTVDNYWLSVLGVELGSVSADDQPSAVSVLPGGPGWRWGSGLVRHPSK
jgi:hypothetical protein